MHSIGGLASESTNATELYLYRKRDVIYAIKKGVALLERITPKGYKEASTGPDAAKWMPSMSKELSSCEQLGALVRIPLSELPQGANVIKCKWVYKIKVDEEGNVTEYKSRLTPKGFMQKYGLDYSEVFAATGQYKTMRLGLSLAAAWDYELDQLDVPSAFLNADIDEEIYMEMPEGFKIPGYVYRVKKAMYGLKQAPRAWSLLIRKFISEEMGFRATVSDPCLFTKRSRSGKLMMIFLFVDDFQVAYDSSDKAEWDELKKKLIDRFKTKDLGASKWILGMRITRDRQARTITMDHELYVTKALEKFGMAQCKPIATPELVRGSKVEGDDVDERHVKDNEPCDRQRYMELVGTLMYPSISTRLDIANSVRVLARSMQDPTHRDMVSAERVLRYLAGTKDIGLVFGRTSKSADDAHTITAYGDADWANDRVDRKSITGWIVKLNGDVISWASKKQHCVSQSTCEAELYAEAAAANEVV